MVKPLTITITDGANTVTVKVEEDVQRVGKALGRALESLGIVTYDVDTNEHSD